MKVDRPSPVNAEQLKAHQPPLPTPNRLGAWGSETSNVYAAYAEYQQTSWPTYRACVIAATLPAITSGRQRRGRRLPAMSHLDGVCEQSRRRHWPRYFPARVSWSAALPASCLPARRYCGLVRGLGDFPFGQADQLDTPRGRCRRHVDSTPRGDQAVLRHWWHTFTSRGDLILRGGTDLEKRAPAKV